MRDDLQTRVSARSTRKQVAAFCALTFALTWPVEWIAALGKLGVTGTKMPGGVQMLAALSPGIAAIVLALRRFDDEGIRRLLGPLLMWRVRPLIYLMAGLISFCGCGFAYLFLMALGQRGVPLTSPIDLIMYFLLILPLSAVWEEIGWRGFVLSRLLRTMTPLGAALLIGVVWGGWHLPIFIAAHTTLEAGLDEFAVMFVGCIAMSIILTWLYLEAKGSLLICVLFHNAVNAAGYYFFVGIPGVSLLPLAVYTAILMVIATALVPTLREARMELTLADPPDGIAVVLG